MNIKMVALPEIHADIYTENGKVYPSGAALNFAVHASEFTGVDITLLGAVGNDENGGLIKDKIGYRRIDISHVRTEKKGVTAFKKVSMTKSRGKCGSEASSAAVEEGVLGSYKLAKAEKNELMIADGVFTTFDSNCLNEIIELKNEYGFRLAVDFKEMSDTGLIDELSGNLDIVLLSGSPEDKDKVRRLSEKHPCLYNLIMKDEGAVSFMNGAEYSAPAVVPDEFVDCNGCVDSYHAALVCGFLKDNNIMKAMQHAAELEAITCEHPGGF